MFERLIFQRIETRILVGITIFVGILLLVGWVAINEGARMATFDREYQARAIERGAALFSSNCATCHGDDGRGRTERAPGLNNPQLFGFDYLKDVNDKIAALDTQTADLQKQQGDLANELVASQTTDARKQEIQQELEKITAQLSASTADGIPAQRDALTTQRDNLIAQMQPAIDLGYNPEQPSRLENVKWGSTLHNFVFTTLKSGRPVSSSYWPEPMPAWSQTAGGPLRDDQLEDLASYVLNWDKGSDWAIEDLLAVQQFAKVPGEGVAAPPFDAVGTDVNAIMAKFASDNIVGDPAHGDALYHGKAAAANGRRLPCAGCHEGGAAAPATEGTWTRIEDLRMKDPQFAGWTGEQYIVDSVVNPLHYVVPGQNNNMPQNFSEQLSIQDLADIIAFLKTQTQPQ